MTALITLIGALIICPSDRTASDFFMQATWLGGSFRVVQCALLTSQRFCSSSSRSGHSKHSVVPTLLCWIFIQLNSLCSSGFNWWAGLASRPPRLILSKIFYYLALGTAKLQKAYKVVGPTFTYCGQNKTIAHCTWWPKFRASHSHNCWFIYEHSETNKN